MSEAEFLAMLDSNGYRYVRRLPTGEWAGLSLFAFTVGIVVGLNEDGYRCRWCYDNAVLARFGLESWDGKDSPPGPWIKQKGKLIDGTVVDRLRNEETV